MKLKTTRSPPLDELFPKIRTCIETGSYRQSRHAIDRESERNIELPDILYVLKKTGYHETAKSCFNETFHTWNYAIRGKTVDNNDIRIIIAFSDDGMLIITVMHIY